MTAVTKPLPYTIEELDSLFILDRENGLLIRKKPARGRKRGETPPKGNYRRVKIGGNLYFEHRIIWMMEHRQDIPQGFEIDHIDRDHYNNRPENLRLAMHRQNLVNREAPSGRSGFRGVLRSRYGRFRASIVENGRRYNLGTFSTAQAAAIAYDAAAIQLHGAFAMTNTRMGLLPAGKACTSNSI